MSTAEKATEQPSPTPHDSVDIVITWVDPTEETWASDYKVYSNLSGNAPEDSSIRYRDWKTLRYTLRGIEKFCPWVGRIYIVTSNAAPTWLAADNDRLKVVHHREIMHESLLPTFNSNAIEANLHRIKGLSERFVYFNDDFFVTAPTSVSHFFQGMLPTGVGSLNALSGDEEVLHNILAAVRLVNRRFSKREVLSGRKDLWFNPRYGRYLARTLALLPWPTFTGFAQLHLPQPLLKSTFETVWEECFEEMEATIHSRFRSPSDVSSYVFSYWQLCRNEFAAISPTAYGRYLQVGRDSWQDIISYVRRPDAKLLCVNDGPILDFERARLDLQEAFDFLLPERSVFEAVE